MANNRNWNEEDTNKLLHLYTVEGMNPYAIADIMDKNYRSVISKLVQMKIYKKPSDDPEVIDRQRTVKQMLIEIEKLLNIKIPHLSFTRKESVEILLNAIKELVDQNS